MKVSIITVVYNNVQTVRDCIDSVLAQDYVDIEYIIIDGDSSDGTKELVASYAPYVSQVISEKDNGLYDAINKGIKSATGDVIGVLHSDDVYSKPSCISQVVEAFRQQATDCVYADLVYVNRENPDKVVRTWRSGKYKRDKFLRGWMPPHPTFFVKRDFFDRYGVYDTSFHSAADYELMVRFLYKYRISASYIPDILVRMRVGGESNKSILNRIRANFEDRMAWRKNHLKPRYYTSLLKPLSKIPQFFTF